MFNNDYAALATRASSTCKGNRYKGYYYKGYCSKAVPCHGIVAIVAVPLLCPLNKARTKAHRRLHTRYLMLSHRIAHMNRHCFSRSTSMPGLQATERFWRDHQGWLQTCGYMLRSRYMPDWQPSWVGTTKDEWDCEDGLRIVSLILWDPLVLL